MLRFFFENAQMSVRSAVKGLDYYRAREYDILCKTMEECPLQGNLRILDLGCGEEVLPSFLCRHTPHVIYAIDIDQEMIALQRKFSSRLSKENHRLQLALMDGLSLAISDNSFDVVINLAMISLLEGEQDISLLSEIARILKPGGILFISIGYEALRHGREQSGPESFFRRYNEELLGSRVLRSNNWREISRTYFGERGAQFSRLWYHLPFVARLPFRWATPMFTKAFCQRLKGRERHCADGVLLALQKM